MAIEIIEIRYGLISSENTAVAWLATRAYWRGGDGDDGSVMWGRGSVTHHTTYLMSFVFFFSTPHNIPHLFHILLLHTTQHLHTSSLSPSKTTRVSLKNYQSLHLPVYNTSRVSLKNYQSLPKKLSKSPSASLQHQSLPLNLQSSLPQNLTAT